MVIVIEQRMPRPSCRGCGGAGARSRSVREVVLVDLPVFGRPARLVWRKQRWRVPDAVVSGRVVDRRGPADRRAAVGVDRPGRAVGDVQVGRHGRTRQRGRRRAGLRLAHRQRRRDRLRHRR